MSKEEIINLFKITSDEELMKYKKSELMSFYSTLYNRKAENSSTRLDLVGEIRLYVRAITRAQAFNKL